MRAGPSSASSLGVNAAAVRAPGASAGANGKRVKPLVVGAAPPLLLLPLCAAPHFPFCFGAPGHHPGVCHETAFTPLLFGDHWPLTQQHGPQDRSPQQALWGHGHQSGPSSPALSTSARPCVLRPLPFSLPIKPPGFSPSFDLELLPLPEFSVTKPAWPCLVLGPSSPGVAWTRSPSTPAAVGFCFKCT